MTEITQKTIANVKKKQFANIITKLNTGKSLNSAEQKILEEYEDVSQEDSKSIIDNDAILKTADLVDFLGLSAVRISELVKDGIAVRQSHGRYYAAKTIKNYIQMLQKGRRSKHGSSASMEELRQRLVDEQGRKEAAVASLRELELKMKAESLVPEYELAQSLTKLLTPLRRLLDGLPRQIAAQANPENPNVAELAVRKGLDDRIFSEIVKVFPE